MTGKWTRQTVDRLRSLLAARGAARLGETSVVSLHVHTTDALDPGRIRVVTSADAGRVFYGRCRRGEVLHIDVFHEVGEVDHRRVAMSILDLAAGTLSEQESLDQPRLIDQVDVQTATGGGRITGDLCHGTKESLRRAHCNHVHLAVRSHPAVYPLLCDMVSTVEDEIIAQGYEIRRLESVSCEQGGGGPGADLSPYTGTSDSLLRDEGTGGGDGMSGQPGPADGVEADGHGNADGDAGIPPDSLYSEPLLDALDLAGDIGGLEELRAVLSHVRDNRIRERRSDDHGLSGWDRQTMLETLKARGLVSMDGRNLSLTSRGEMLHRYLCEYREEILRMMRRVARKTPQVQLRPDNGNVSQVTSNGHRGKRTRQVGRADSPGADELAVAETVIQACGNWPATGRLRFGRDDFRYSLRRQQKKQDICLLIDASASMAGKRLRAARHLAHHLVLATRDRVAVVVFQERQTKIICPFTRDRRLLERTISQMQAFGLTPLAGALVDTIEYIKSSRAKSPLVLLITDGVPTIPRWSLNPLVDAIQAARDVSRRRLGFACVGLEPNRAFLDRLCAAAGGHLYIVDELDRDVLVAIARRERVYA